MRKTTKHTIYTIEQKNKIVKEYLNGVTGRSELIRKYDIASKSVLARWIEQYRKNKTTIDNRGRNNPQAGKYSRKKRINPEEMSRKELIEYVTAVEDIKKLMVCLKQQKKNIKQ